MTFEIDDRKYRLDTDEEIQAFIETGDLGKIHARPDSKCKHCYGRGYEGVNVYAVAPGQRDDEKIRLYAPCRCLRKEFERRRAHNRQADLEAGVSKGGADKPGEELEYETG